MSIVTLIAAFGGGVFGSLIGATTAFIFTGILALIGIAVSLSGGGDVVLNEIAFGPLFGPHVAFAGGVAAAAYLGRKKKKELERAGVSGSDAQEVYGHDNPDVDNEYLNRLVDGADTATPLFKSNDPIALLVGGVFGALGYALNYLFSADMLNFPMDTVALVVLISGLAARFVFGKSGLTGNYPANESKFGPVNSNLLFTAIWSIAYAAVVGYVAIELNMANIGFAISAASLIFIYFGLSFPVTHHIAMVAGYAAIQFGNIWMAMLFGLLAAILGEYTQRAVNTHVDTHIDMPATVIALFSLIILGIF